MKILRKLRGRGPSGTPQTLSLLPWEFYLRSLNCKMGPSYLPLGMLLLLLRRLAKLTLSTYLELSAVQAA